MGTLQTIGRILKPPRKEDLFNAPREIKQEMQKGKMKCLPPLALLAEISDTRSAA